MEALWLSDPGTEQCFYSYSLNAHGDSGMASFISRDRTLIIRNKHASIRNPSGKIILAEEKGAVNDGPGAAVIEDGRWLPPGYPLTSRHSKRANVLQKLLESPPPIVPLTEKIELYGIKLLFRPLNNKSYEN